MRGPKNECIASRAFASLILDYEWEENKIFNIPAEVSCRILIEDLFQEAFTAPTREAAIEYFNNWHRS